MTKYETGLALGRVHLTDGGSVTDLVMLVKRENHHIGEKLPAAAQPLISLGGDAMPGGGLSSSASLTNIAEWRSKAAQHAQERSAIFDGEGSPGQEKTDFLGILRKFAVAWRDADIA